MFLAFWKKNDTKHLSLCVVMLPSFLLIDFMMMLWKLLAYVCIWTENQYFCTFVFVYISSIPAKLLLRKHKTCMQEIERKIFLCSGVKRASFNYLLRETFVSVENFRRFFDFGSKKWDCFSLFFVYSAENVCWNIKIFGL